MTAMRCESCGMPIESGPYCGRCTDAHGRLQSFEERFERMLDWQVRQQPGAPREELVTETLAYLSTMPAWRDHPAVRSR